MRAFPRILTVIAMGAALVLLPPPVGAQEGGGTIAPRAEAQATALRINLFGQELILSSADAMADATPSGVARGTGALLADTSFGESEAVAGPSTPTAGSADPTCSPLTLPDTVPVPVGGITACSSAQAAAGDGQGSSTAAGLTTDLQVGSTADLAGLGLPVDDLVDTLIDPLLDLVGGIPLPGDLAQLDVLLGVLLDNPLTLANIRSGDTEATTTASEDGAAATATSEGVRIELLDSSVLGPLATVVIGESAATATFEDGAPRAAHALAPVTLELGLALATALGTNVLSLPVPVGQVVDIPLPAPLQSRITVTDGADTVEGLAAESTGGTVRLDLFTGLPDGGIVLAASDTAAAVEGAAPTPPPPAEPPTPPAGDLDPPTPPEGPADRGAAPQPRGALPRTGGDGSWIPIGVLMAVAAGVALIGLRRSRTAPQG